MSVNAEKARDILPQLLKEFKLTENCSICSQIQSAVQQIGIITSVKDFSKEGPDAQSYFVDSIKYEPLTKITDPQLYSILGLIYDNRQSLTYEDEIVIGQLHDPESVKVYVEGFRSKGDLTAELMVYIPQRRHDGLLLGLSPIAIDSNGNMGTESRGIVHS